MATPALTVRNDFYQRDNKVRLNLYVKNLNKDTAIVEFTESTLHVKLTLPSEEVFDQTYHLFRNVDASACSYKIMSTKVEIELVTIDYVKWTSIEKSEVESIDVSMPAAPMEAAPVGDSAVNKYPTSGKNYRDWDKIEAEQKELEKTEKKEGDEGLNSLFQTIFKDGTPEQQRAMMKSFTESGGTVLSTNWDEVGQKKIEVQPPDGMEFKKWDS